MQAEVQRIAIGAQILASIKLVRLECRSMKWFAA
jgi:hypothetical protein